MSVNITNIGGYVCGNVRMTKLNDGSYIVNFGLSAETGHGKSVQNNIYNCMLFAKEGKQKEFYESLIVKGQRLLCSGVMRQGKPYQKDGVEITPWVFVVSEVDMNINNICISGRLTDDAIVSVKNEVVIARFTVAVDRFRKNEKTVDYIRCTKFGKGGFEQYANDYMKKGRKIGVIGRMQTGSYTNGDGIKINTTEIVVDNFELYGNKPTNGNDAENAKEIKSNMQPSSEPTSVPASSSATASASPTELPENIPPLDSDIPQELLDSLMEGFIDIPDDVLGKDVPW